MSADDGKIHNTGWTIDEFNRMYEEAAKKPGEPCLVPISSAMADVEARASVDALRTRFDAVAQRYRTMLVLDAVALVQRMSGAKRARPRRARALKHLLEMIEVYNGILGTKK